MYTAQAVVANEVPAWMMKYTNRRDGVGPKFEWSKQPFRDGEFVGVTDGHHLIAVKADGTCLRISGGEYVILLMWLKDGVAKASFPRKAK